MKKRTFLLALVLTALVFVGYAVAAGGDASDPLVSLDFLNGTFRRQAEERIDEAVTKADAGALDDAKAVGTPRSRRRRPLSAPTTPPSLPKRASSRTTFSPASQACRSSLSPVS